MFLIPRIKIKQFVRAGGTNGVSPVVSVAKMHFELCKAYSNKGKGLCQVALLAVTSCLYRRQPQLLGATLIPNSNHEPALSEYFSVVM